MEAIFHVTAAEFAWSASVRTNDRATGFLSGLAGRWYSSDSIGRAIIAAIFSSFADLLVFLPDGIFVRKKKSSTSYYLAKAMPHWL